jgi:hypothetical protein
MALPPDVYPWGLNGTDALAQILRSHTGEDQRQPGGATRVFSARFSAMKDIDLAAPAAGAVDTLVHTVPAGTPLVLDSALVQVVTAPTAGAGMTNLSLQLGTSVGGAQLIAAQSFAAGSLPAANTVLGLATAQLGTGLPAANNFRLFHDGSAPLSVSFRATATGGGVASGRVRVVVSWRPLA